MTTHHFSLASPLGAIRYEVDQGFLLRLGFAGDPVEPDARDEIGHNLCAYFAGDLAALLRVRVRAHGTPFFARVWSELRRLEPGAPISYAELARRIGRPTAVRAVARANAMNPIALVVPCHRVIGSDGELRGYAYGLDRKAWLLAHESAATRGVASREALEAMRPPVAIG